MLKAKIKKNDEVVVTQGRDSGAKGRVLRVYPSQGKAIVERINMIRRHTRPNPNKQIKMISSKSLPSKHKAMNQALELLVQDETLGNRAMPNFSRGPEIEITTMQDVEMMKAMLAQLKIHIPT